jgi:parvulin-like peptidyl-prolyl isomerase
MRIASAAAVLASLVATALGAEEIDSIVLRVNDEIATRVDYDTRRDARAEAIARASDLPAEERRKMAADSGRSAMREIFEELLVFSRAQQLRLEASPEEIDRAVESARRRYGVESDEEFERGLAQSGTTIAAFRARMAKNIVFNEVLQREISPRIKIDEEEIARYWREHPQEFNVAERRRVEEIVVRDTAPGTAEERRALAVELRDLMVEGKSIAEAIAAKSADASVLVLEHGWIERGALDGALETTAWELGAGGIGGPLDGRGGLHVLRVLEIAPANVRPLEEVRGQIQSKLEEAGFEAKSAEFLEELAASAYIVENLPPDAVGYRTAVSGARDPVRELMRGGPPKVETPAAPASEATPPAPPPASPSA